MSNYNQFGNYQKIDAGVYRESVLQEAERLINGDRAAQYGPPKKNFEDIAQGWSQILGVIVTPSDVALCMIWLKMMRYKHGYTRDSVVDIAGYAGTIEKLW